jgi:hypothetical protein
MAIETEKFALWAGIALTITASMALMAVTTWLAFVPFALGIGMFTWALYRYMGCQAGDERMQKIVIYAMTNSWLATFFMEAMYVMFVLAHVLEYRPIDVLGVTIITMVLIFSAWFIYFSRKGDVA